MPRKLWKVTEDDFWGLVDRRDEHECWLWKGRLRQGYGTWGRQHAHRAAYEFFYKVKLPHAGHAVCVLHKCDNRACCNPYHLYKGTQADNMRDARVARKKKHPERYAGKSEHMPFWLLARLEAQNKQ